MERKKYYAAACLIFRDSAAYLPEWLAFHIAVGFEHFYLYNNESSDNWEEVIRPFVKNGYITTQDFPGSGVQQEVYNDCLDNYAEQSQWIAFIDDDEFLFPTEQSLTDLLKEFEPFAGLAIHWMLYGSSGIKEKPEGYVIENYTRRHPNADQHVKCIVNTDKIDRSILIGHQFSTKENWLVVNEEKMPIRGPVQYPAPTNRIRINHYLVKSLEELEFRRGRIRADTGKLTPLTLEQWLELDASWSIQEDPIAKLYMEKMDTILDRMR